MAYDHQPTSSITDTQAASQTTYCHVYYQVKGSSKKKKLTADYALFYILFSMAVCNLGWYTQVSN